MDQFRWSEVVSFASSARREIGNGVTRTIYKWGCTLVDGRHFAIGRQGEHGRKADFSSGLERIAATLDPLVTRALIPRVEETLRRGEKVKFGQFVSADTKGLYYFRDFLGWPELEEVKIENGQLSIRKRGKKRKWADLEVSAVSNFPLFLQLLHGLGGGYGARLP